MKMVFYVGLILVAALQAYVRLSPMDAEVWHVDPFDAEARKDGAALVRFSSSMSPTQTLEAFEAVALATARTQVLAGTPDSGRMSFITRSALWGFPDVTTIGVREAGEGSEVAIFARLRFGKSDLGVNAKRVAAWRAAVGI